MRHVPTNSLPTAVVPAHPKAAAAEYRASSDTSHPGPARRSIIQRGWPAERPVVPVAGRRAAQTSATLARLWPPPPPKKVGYLKLDRWGQPHASQTNLPAEHRESCGHQTHPQTNASATHCSPQHCCCPGRAAIASAPQAGPKLLGLLAPRRPQPSPRRQQIESFAPAWTCRVFPRQPSGSERIPATGKSMRCRA